MIIAEHGRRIRITKPKSEDELMHTRRAVGIVKEILDEISPFGRREEDVAKEIRSLIRKKGGTLPFKPIVASGRNTGKVHHIPGRKIVREEEPVIFDLGAKYLGCCSDVTRMHLPRKSPARKLFTGARAMQEKVIAMARPGVEFRDLHYKWEALMKRRGYKPMHLIGHGIGSQVHERVKGPLQEGMVLSIEPGIYFKGKYGCRIEDMILIRKKGPEVLSRSIPAWV